jgi:hypothetical protein
MHRHSLVIDDESINQGGHASAEYEHALDAIRW